MDVQHVLLSPKGRIGPRDFSRGLILLTGAMMIIQIAAALVSPAFGILQYPLVFSYVCVFGKRLHDGGRSAWLYLAFLAGYFFIVTVGSAVLLPILSPGAYSMQAEFQKLAQSGGISAAFEAMTNDARELARESVLTTIVTFLAASGILGLIGRRLNSDPSSNIYGPPTEQAGQPDTFS
ncbi:MAG: hypothetical protein V7675_13040 [Hyphomonas sp.]|uniref:hypothetical protein n=1 Tax=Hyphomonas sp. TaxID=87 RepID=UPI00300135F8